MNGNYGPKVEWDALQVGVRIYYTGDMANSSDYGVITRRHPIDPKWNYRQVDIVTDDGREWRAVHLVGFQPSPGKRWWLEADYKADRARRVAEMEAEYAKRRTA